MTDREALERLRELGERASDDEPVIRYVEPS